jgi:SHS2 domain-containing protein
MDQGTAATVSSWAHFSHDADIGVVGTGSTKAEAFRQAALALTAVITDPSNVRPVQPVPVFCQAQSDEMLLVEWLSALVYEMAVRTMLFGDFAVEISPAVMVHSFLQGSCDRGAKACIPMPTRLRPARFRLCRTRYPEG